MLDFIALLNGSNTLIQSLSELWTHMKSAPVTILYSIIAIAILYYLPRKVAFFKNVSLGGSDKTFFESNMLSKDFFSSKKRDPVLKNPKNPLATAIYTLIFIILLSIFISLVFNLSTEF